MKSCLLKSKVEAPKIKFFVQIIVIKTLLYNLFFSKTTLFNSMFVEVKSVVLFNHSGDLMHIKYLHLSHRQAVFKMYSFAK